MCVAFFAVFVDTPTQKDQCAVYLHLKKPLPQHENTRIEY